MSVPVDVHLVWVGNGRAVVTGIAQAVHVLVGLVRVGHVDAVVAVIAEGIAVGVVLAWVLDGRTVIAEVSGPVAVRVHLIVVRNLGAVVALEADGRGGESVGVDEGDRAVGESVSVFVHVDGQVLATECEVLDVEVSVRVGVAILIHVPSAGGIFQVDRDFVRGVHRVAVEVLRQAVVALLRVHGRGSETEGQSGENLDHVFFPLPSRRSARLEIGAAAEPYAPLGISKCS